MFAQPTFVTRHAESTVNAYETTRHLQYTAAIDLSVRGEQQRAELAAWYPTHLKEQGLRSITLIVSPFRRTQLTAKPVITALRHADIQVVVREENLLREVNSGFYAGKLAYAIAFEEQQRQQANKDGCFHYIIPPGGESLAQALDRAVNFRIKHTLLEPIGTDCIGIIGHGLQGRLQVMEYLEHDWEWFWWQPNLLNAGTFRIERGKDPAYLFTPTAQSAEAPILAQVPASAGP